MLYVAKLVSKSETRLIVHVSIIHGVYTPNISGETIQNWLKHTKNMENPPIFKFRKPSISMGNFPVRKLLIYQRVSPS